MDIETNSPAVAARFILSRFRQGKGAKVSLPNKAEFYFANSVYFGGEAAGIFVSCTKGGCVVFPSPERVNRFMCIRARMPGWAAGFVVDTVQELLRQSRLLAHADEHVIKIGKAPE